MDGTIDRPRLLTYFFTYYFLSVRSGFSSQPEELSIDVFLLGVALCRKMVIIIEFYWSSWNYALTGQPHPIHCTICRSSTKSTPDSSNSDIFGGALGLSAHSIVIRFLFPICGQIILK